MGRKKKATILNQSQKEKIPSSSALSTSELSKAADSPNTEKENLAALGTQYQDAKTEPDGSKPRKERSTYRSKKEEALAAEEAKRADIQSSGEAFGDGMVMILDMWFRRTASKIPLSDFEKESLRGATSRVAVKYIAVDFKYKEEIILLTVLVPIVATRLIPGME